jgi:flagellar biosynthesis/type III secretory pathway chaperone
MDTAMTTPVLDKQLAGTQALLTILQREYAALLSGNLEQIELIVQEKRMAVAELESLSQTQPHASHVVPATNPRLKAVAAECVRQNEINGGMVEASLRHTQHVLAILHGQPPEAGLYSRAGAALNASPTRPLTSA